MTEMIARLQQIADRFDHVLLDQWGALHEGKGLFRQHAIASLLCMNAASRFSSSPIPASARMTICAG